MNYSRIIALIRKDLMLEWRQPQQILSMLLYLVSTVFIMFLVFQGVMKPEVWNALFWISYLFTSSMVASRSFQRESGARFYFFYTLCSPAELMLSKYLFNGFLFTLVGIANWGLFSLFLGNMVFDGWMFLTVCSLAGFGFSGVLTLINGIAVKVKNHPALSAILGFPLMLPTLLVVLSASSRAMVGTGWEEAQSLLLALAGLSLASAVLSVLLYPFLWKE